MDPCKLVELAFEHLEENQNTCGRKNSCKIIELFLEHTNDKHLIFHKSDKTGRISLHYDLKNGFFLLCTAAYTYLNQLSRN